MRFAFRSKAQPAAGFCFAKSSLDLFDFPERQLDQVVNNSQLRLLQDVKGRQIADVAIVNGETDDNSINRILWKVG